MELIESQANEVRNYLSQPILPVSLDASPAVSHAYDPSPGAAAPHNHSPRSASAGDNSAHMPSSRQSSSNTNANASANINSSGSGSNNKRKSIDDNGQPAKQTRSKRNRYISIACNQCKRRKIKCNGETPCQRCGNLDLECLYTPNCCSNSFKDSDEFKQVNAQLSRLQDQVAWLNQSMKTLQTDSSRSGPQPDRPNPASSSGVTPSPSHSSTTLQRPESTLPRRAFAGPTSMAFSLDIANNTIANMGYKETAADAEEEDDEQEEPPMQITEGSAEPLCDFGKDELVRLCRLHEEEIGIMYPVLDIQRVINHAKNLASYFERLAPRQPPEPINNLPTLELKMVLCCALVVDESGHSEKAIRLYRSMELPINRKLMSDESSAADLPLLALYAGYRFLSNDEVLAWRVMGSVARLCLELGIHQKSGLEQIGNEEAKKDALNSFWTAYVLDRRWAFGTGLPFTVQDEEIDSNLPYPEEYPYLVAMINYSRLGAKVWRQVSRFDHVLSRVFTCDEFEQLDAEILQWYETVPDEVKVRNWDKEKQMTSTPSYNLQRLRIWTYLRLNQLRIWLYTPILHSATTIMDHPQQSQRVVDLAKDTIRYLTHLNETTNLYRRVQVFYNQFVASAVAVLFLASVHAPVRFSTVCREEFYQALELIKDLSAKSSVSKRLWKTIRSLKHKISQLRLNPEDDVQSSAALGMLGLAQGGQSPFQQQQQQHHHQQQQALAPPQTLPNQAGLQQGEIMQPNGPRIQSDFSRIFEGYVALSSFQPGPVEGPPSGPHTEMPSPDSVGGIYGQNGTLYDQLKEMF